MIEAIVGYAKSPRLTERSGTLEEELRRFDFIEVCRPLRSGRVVGVAAKARSIAELQARLGSAFIAEPHSKMMAL